MTRSVKDVDYIIMANLCIMNLKSQHPMPKVQEVIWRKKKKLGYRTRIIMLARN